jgi:hypothetical protein
MSPFTPKQEKAPTSAAGAGRGVVPGLGRWREIMSLLYESLEQCLCDYADDINQPLKWIEAPSVDGCSQFVVVYQTVQFLGAPPTYTFE